MDRPTSVNRELVLSVPTDGSRGRNGWFVATRLGIHASPGADATNTLPPMRPCVQLTAYSKRYGSMPPILLTVSLEDAVLLAEELLAAVRTIYDADGEPEAAHA